MNLRTSLFGLVGGAALLTMAAAPAVWAKTKDSGSVSGTCLASDSALQTAEGISDPNIGPVTVTIAPGTLWPPNHKMRTEDLTASLTQPFNPDPAASPYDNGANITVWLVDVTDDQVADDDLGGHGCGKPTARQGSDWSPAASLSDSTSYDTASVTLTDATPVALQFSDSSSNSVDVGLRGERCAKDGTRTYTLSIVCCDTTTSGSPVCDDANIQAYEQSGGTLQAATTTEEVDVIVPKSRGHHH